MTEWQPAQQHPPQIAARSNPGFSSVNYNVWTMKVAPRLLLTAVLLSACRSSPAGASPCSGIDRSVESDRKAALALALAKESRVATVDIY